MARPASSFRGALRNLVLRERESVWTGTQLAQYRPVVFLDWCGYPPSKDYRGRPRLWLPGSPSPLHADLAILADRRGGVMAELTRETSGLVVAPSENGDCLELWVEGTRLKGATVDLVNVEDGGQELRIFIDSALVTFGQAPKAKTAQLRAIGGAKKAAESAAPGCSS
jgi:hypothetical protein